MTSRRIPRHRALLALAAIGFVVAANGCEREPDEVEPTTPQAVYQQPPEDLCELVRYDEVLQQQDLTVPSYYEPADAYDAGRFRWYVGCRFNGVAEDDRFTTEFGDFGTSGGVSLSVYYNVADAVHYYDQLARGHIEHHAERVPGAATAEVTGWWDSGVSLELPEEVDPADYVLGDFEVTNVGVEWLVRHENLVVQAHARGLAPTSETAEVAALLHDVVAGVLDESVDHLTLTTE